MLQPSVCRIWSSKHYYSFSGSFELERVLRAAPSGGGPALAAGAEPRHLLDVGAGGLAERGDGVDGADALREHGVGGELGELRGPEVGEQDALAGHPVRVDVRQRRRRLAPALRVLATDQNLRVRGSGFSIRASCLVSWTPPCSLGPQTLELCQCFRSVLPVSIQAAVGCHGYP